MIPQSRPAGILFGDVAGSTLLYETLGDTAALAAIAIALGLMADAVRARGGRIVKTLGDEIMAALPDARSACDAAMDMQRAVDAQDPVSGPKGSTKLGIQVGFHFGDVLDDGEDCFGDTVNIASRMVGMAREGQILTTGATLTLLAPAQQAATRDLDRLPVRGKAEEVRVIEVIWQESAEMTMMFSTHTTAREPVRRLAMQCDGRTFLFDATRVRLALGRDASNDVTVADARASRKHATIERRREKWVLVDHSTNGTFIRSSGEPEIELRREEMMLRGAGVISFGHPFRGDAAECARYEVLEDEGP
jgi:class 3 adenylate cyclase